jgi:hypothetical protein
VLHCGGVSPSCDRRWFFTRFEVRLFGTGILTLSFLPANGRTNVQKIGSKLTIDFERPKNRQTRVGRRSGIAGALFNVEINSTTTTQSATIFTTQRAGRQGQ